MIASLLAALALATPSASFPGIFVTGGFLTPSGNIACNVGRLGPKTTGPFAIGCSVYSKRSAKGNSVWWMTTTGPVSFGYFAADPASDYPKLSYGKKYTWRGITCTSATAGLRCRNKGGHGFFLSRGSQRVF